MTKYSDLKKRIKLNEGFKSSVYFDQLGFATIGYGHLIRKKEKHFLKKEYSKKYLLIIFESDFELALSQFEKHYGHLGLKKKTKDMVIEMIFQLGIKGQKKFKLMNLHLKKNEIHMACLEMRNSLWYTQTPKRVNKLITSLLNTNER